MKKYISIIILAFIISVSMAGIASQKSAGNIPNYYAMYGKPVVAKLPIVDPGQTPAYKVSGPIVLKSNTTYKYLTIDCKGANIVAVTGNGVSNVHITHLRILNTPNMAIKLYKCTNITVDSCYFNMVMFGVYAQNCITVKINSNQLLNLNDAGLMPVGYVAHAFQFDRVTGGGNQINNNRVENIPGIANRPHDILSVYQSNGLPGDSIQVIGNWIRGGQMSYYGKTASQIGACGIGYGDVAGSYTVVRGNILVNPAGCGIQTVGNGTNLKMDHNIIYINLPKPSAINALGISVQDQIQTYVGYNRINITDQKGFNGLASSGWPAYWNPSTTPTPTDWDKNVWQDKTVTENILPAVIITMK